MMLTLYQLLVILLLVFGLLLALSFLADHRPRNWRRVEALDASGWVLVVALALLRSLVLMALRWPVPPPRSVFDAVFSLTTLVALDVLLAVRIRSWRAFKARDRAAHQGGNQ